VQHHRVFWEGGTGQDEKKASSGGVAAGIAKSSRLKLGR